MAGNNTELEQHLQCATRSEFLRGISGGQPRKTVRGDVEAAAEAEREK